MASESQTRCGWHQRGHSGSEARERPQKHEKVPLAAQRGGKKTPRIRFPSLSLLPALAPGNPGSVPGAIDSSKQPRPDGYGDGGGSRGLGQEPRAFLVPARGPRAGMRRSRTRWRVGGWVARERAAKERVRRELPPERVARARGLLGDVLANGRGGSCLWGRSVAMAAGEAFGAAT